MIAADSSDMIRTLRVLIAEREADAARMRRELAKLLEQTGRRPGDGSDQLSLFGNDRQPKLFG